MRSTSQRLKTFPIAMILLLLFGIMAPANAGSDGLPSYADLADQVKDPVDNPDEFRQQLRQKASKDSLLLLVKRGGATFYVVLQKTPDAG